MDNQIWTFVKAALPYVTIVIMGILGNSARKG